MRGILLVLLLSSTACSAYAADCTKSVSNELDSSYHFPDTGEVVSSKPSLVTYAALECGDFTYSVTPITEVSTNGRYGNRPGDEIDFTFTYDHDINTVIGPVAVEASVGYWELSKFGGLYANVPVYLELARHYVVGKATVTPFIRATQWIGVGGFPNTTFVRPGVRFETPLTQKISLATEVTESFDLTDKRNTLYGNIQVSRNFGRGWTGSLVFRPSEHLSSVFGISTTKNW